MVQVQSFQEKIQTDSPPVTLLLDCSELELARNLGQRRARIDDNKVCVCVCVFVFVCVFVCVCIVYVCLSIVYVCMCVFRIL